MTLVFALLLLQSGVSAQEPELRGRIKEALFAADPLPELRPERHGRFEPEPGVIAERISYGTQFGMRVPAILYRPKTPRGKAPALCRHSPEPTPS